MLHIPLKKFYMKRKLKILITGGAGFIGAHLTEKLIKLGHKILVVDILKPRVEFLC